MGRAVLSHQSRNFERYSPLPPYISQLALSPISCLSHPFQGSNRSFLPKRSSCHTMEVIAATATHPRPTLGRPSPSFRLRTESLNTLRLRRIFDLFDNNGDGEITIEEIALALDRLGLGADAAELQSTVAAYIPPGRTGLAFDDFEALHRALGDALFGAPATVEEEGEEAATEEEDMREAFRVFDEDGDGFISSAELQAVLSKLGLPEARNIAKVREMICSVDRNSDGQVDFGEFKHMMQGITVWGA